LKYSTFSFFLGGALASLAYFLPGDSIDSIKLLVFLISINLLRISLLMEERNDKTQD